MNANAITQSTLLPPLFLPLQRESRKREFMHCDVIFGAPSADCRGTGMCKIVARHPTQPTGLLHKDCKTTQAIFMRNERGSGPMMILFREHLCIHLLRNHLRGGVLTMTEPCALPLALIRKLGIPQRRIPAGQYSVEEASGHFKIDFNPA